MKSVIINLSKIPEWYWAGWKRSAVLNRCFTAAQDALEPVQDFKSTSRGCLLGRDSKRVQESSVNKPDTTVTLQAHAVCVINQKNSLPLVMMRVGPGLFINIHGTRHSNIWPEVECTEKSELNEWYGNGPKLFLGKGAWMQPENVLQWREMQLDFIRGALKQWTCLQSSLTAMLI